MAERKRPQGLERLVDLLFNSGEGPGAVKQIQNKVRRLEDSRSSEVVGAPQDEQQLEQPQGGGTRKVLFEDQPKKARNLIDMLFN